MHVPSSFWTPQDQHDVNGTSDRWAAIWACAQPGRHLIQCEQPLVFLSIGAFASLWKLNSSL